MGIKKYNDKDNDFHYFKISKKDYRKYKAYSKFIQKQLKNRNRVPLRVFKKYESFFVELDSDKEGFYRQQLDKLCEEVIDYFKPQKDYYYSGTRLVEVWGTDIIWNNEVEVVGG
jgi:hypothetical protein